MVSLATEGSRLSPGNRVLYIEYLGIAPANLRPPWGTQVLKGLGMFLVQRAAEMALEHLEGRVGLHALPNVEAYYPKLRFTAVGREETDDGKLLYFELTPAGAKLLVDEGLIRDGN